MLNTQPTDAARKLCQPTKEKNNNNRTCEHWPFFKQKSFTTSWTICNLLRLMQILLQHADADGLTEWDRIAQHFIRAVTLNLRRKQKSKTWLYRNRASALFFQLRVWTCCDCLLFWWKLNGKLIVLYDTLPRPHRGLYLESISKLVYEERSKKRMSSKSKMTDFAIISQHIKEFRCRREE